MDKLKEKLLSAIDNIDFDNMCENQKSALEMALVMLWVKWGKINNLESAINLRCGGDNIPTPVWDWSSYTYTIIEPKKTVPMDFSDAEKLIGKAVKKKFIFLDGTPITKEV